MFHLWLFRRLLTIAHSYPVHGYNVEGDKYQLREASFGKGGPFEKRDDTLKKPKVRKNKANAPPKPGKPYWPTEQQGAVRGNSYPVAYLDAQVAARSQASQS